MELTFAGCAGQNNRYLYGFIFLLFAHEIHFFIKKNVELVKTGGNLVLFVMQIRSNSCKSRKNLVTIFYNVESRTRLISTARGNS